MTPALHGVPVCPPPATTLAPLPCCVLAYYQVERAFPIMPTLGFLLLAPSSVPGYWGVDRNWWRGRAEPPPNAPRDYQDSPFVPMLIDGEIMDPSFWPKKGDDPLWAFYPDGWRRDAYRLYEENVVDPGKWDPDRPDLLSNREVAQKIREIIKPHLGPYEIVACSIWELNSVPSDEAEDKKTFLGYDVAYPPGGDYFSAIRNGLFGGMFDPDPGLVEQYRNLLNEFGLFSNTSPILAYFRRFQELYKLEADSEFCVYMLESA